MTDKAIRNDHWINLLDNDHGVSLNSTYWRLYTALHPDVDAAVIYIDGEEVLSEVEEMIWRLKELEGTNG